VSLSWTGEMMGSVGTLSSSTGNGGRCGHGVVTLKLSGIWSGRLGPRDTVV
jgi:hypothetical protein